MNITIAATAMLLASASSAFAQEGTAPDWANKSGGVGVGGNTTLGGASGVHVRTYVTPQIGLQLTLGYTNTSTETDPSITDENTRLDLGLGGSYRLKSSGRASLSGLFGIDIVRISRDLSIPPAPSTDESATDLRFALGLVGEYFPTRYLSLSLAAGLVIDPIQDDEVTGDMVSSGNNRSGFELDLAGQLQGSAGFTVWFK